MNTVSHEASTEPMITEGAMSVLLAGLMALVIAEQLFNLPLSLAPGVSIDNAFLYLVAAALVFKFAVRRNFRFELRGFHTCFAVLIAYAALTIPAVAILAPFQNYEVVQAIISFKTRLLDHLVFFVVFFYGLQSSRSALSVLKALLAMTALANLVALLDAWGFVEAGGLVDREDGRAQGVMGESNQSAAFIAAFLPMLVVFALTTPGVGRLMWLAGAAVSATAMTISASRGGFLATIVSTLWALLYFRRYVSGRSLVIASVVGAAIFVVLVPIIASRYGFLLFSRVVQDSTSSNLAGASSGRLDIWANAFARMAESPLSFFTGFGWGAYDAMPFRYNSHNHFVSLWFDLGLLGLFCGTAVLVLAARIAMRAVPTAVNHYRPVLAAFATGAFAISIAAFFVNLYTPWLWFWAYAGLSLRIAVNAFRYRAHVDLPVVPKRAESEPTRDPFGWIATAGRSAGR